MRIWKYYLDKAALKVNEGVAFTTARERYALYAITNDKKKAQEFKVSRNEKAFIEQTAKIDKDEWKGICQKYTGCVLLYTDLLTKQDRDKIENPRILDDYTKTVRILMTMDEKLRTETYGNGGEDLCMLPVIKKGTFENIPCPNMFTKFFDGIMREMIYQQQYKFAFGYGSNNPAYIPNRHEDDYAPFDLKFGGADNFYFDELTMFIWEYGDLFK